MLLIDGLDVNIFMENETRYSILENDEGLPNAVFFINEVTYDDNHIVMCVADNVDGFDQTVTEMAVRGKPSFPFRNYLYCTLSGVTFALLGQSHTCQTI